MVPVLGYWLTCMLSGGIYGDILVEHCQPVTFMEQVFECAVGINLRVPL